MVFDAYRRPGSDRSSEKCGGLTVIYTKEAETADAYIEKWTYGMADKYEVKVVTSDYTEQLVILGCGGLRITPGEFSARIRETEEIAREMYTIS